MSILHSGEFLDYSNNIIRVTFWDDSNKLNKTADLRFSGKLPVVIDNQGDVGEIFVPMRSSSCDITIVSKYILSDLYTTDKKGIKVKVEKITKTSTVRLFEGYMTPNTYSQHLNPNLDNIDMTAICPLALLKYVNVDEIFEKAKTITIGEVIAKALAMVKIDANEIQIEDVVEYEDGKFIDMLVQTYNFWDEGGDASTVYDAVSECLRLFGYTMTFTGEKYIVYNAITDHTSGDKRNFFRYKIEDSGVLSAIGYQSYNTSNFLFRYSSGDWTAIDDNPTISIEDTYERITGVASTRIPDFSTSAFDMIDSEDRDKYDAADVNVNRNIIKGYDAYGKLITEDEWYYIWNGVYVAPDHGLEINGVVVNGFANINNAYTYMTGQTGHPNASGGLLNFYGGEPNPIGVGKDPAEERPVDVKRCITVFAPDNGVVPEFLDKSDLEYGYSLNYDYEEGYSNPECYKRNENDAKFGTNKTGVADGISYKQVFENITMLEGAEQTLVIDISQKYSRTGIAERFDIGEYSIAENISYIATSEDDYGNVSYTMSSADIYAYFWPWSCDNITVDYGYFNKYNAGSQRIKEVWDRRKFYVYIEMLNGVKYQFNGKDWVETTAVSDENAFYLKKLMNFEKIFDGEFTYNIIECSDGDEYAFNEDGWKYRKNGGGVVKSGGDEEKFEYYIREDYSWYKYIDDVSEGRMSIILPTISGVNCNIKCEVYHSSLLGMTGNSNNKMRNNYALDVRYKDKNDDSVSSIRVTNDFMPVNATYIKAEHLDIDISMSVPESNLGQMFGESDIKYQTASSRLFRESYDCPEFLVNTKHQIVAVSNSYLIYNNGFADPNKFKINNIYTRPENYVIQGYKNYWSVIRKIYSRLLVPNKSGFSNTMCYIEAPDIPDNGKGKWMLVVSDSYDVKTNRHTITAVDDYDLAINTIDNYTVIEIPRKSRNPRYDLPSVEKRTTTNK